MKLCTSISVPDNQVNKVFAMVLIPQVNSAPLKSILRSFHFQKLSHIDYVKIICFTSFFSLEVDSDVI